MRSGSEAFRRSGTSLNEHSYFMRKRRIEAQLRCSTARELLERGGIQADLLRSRIERNFFRHRSQIDALRRIGGGKLGRSGSNADLLRSSVRIERDLFRHRIRERRLRRKRRFNCDCRRHGRDHRRISGRSGMLVQSRDTALAQPDTFKIVTERQPTPTQYADLWFAWRVCKYVKSNAIVFAREGMTIGVGAGQMSRVYSTRVAALKAKDEGLIVEGSAMASDAFFPFRDGIDVAAEYGIKAIVQPGGSKRDEEVIAAANEHGMTMVFTGMRHFRH